MSLCKSFEFRRLDLSVLDESADEDDESVESEGAAPDEPIAGAEAETGSDEELD